MDQLPCLLMVALIAACSPSRDAATVDLTRHRTGFSADRAEWLRIEATSGQRAVIRSRVGTLDMYLRLPDDAELQYRIPAEHGIVRPSAEVGGSYVPLSATQGADGTMRVALPPGMGDIASLRLLVVDPRRPAWLEPRVVGHTTATPPILDPELRPHQRGPLNVILYVVDTLRTDRLALYGHQRPTSPRLSRLAERAIVFDNAYSAGAYTSPSITALFSSRFPSEVRGRLAPDGPAQQTLAEVFQAAGYDTAAFQANPLCMPRLGYSRGFDDYRQMKRAGGTTGTELPTAAELHAAALDWVHSRDGERPFFLYVQSMDVHAPYAPPAPFRDMFMPAQTSDTQNDIEVMAGDTSVPMKILEAVSRERYDAGVAYADHELGILFDTLERMGLADDTVVLITADHGEPLSDHGEVLHGRSLYEELVRVPLVLWIPGLDHAERVQQIVSLLDVAPTLADLAGIPVPAQFLGRSWLAPGTTLEPPAAMGELVRPIDHEPLGWYVREGPWKLIADGHDDALTYRLFHLPTDPHENVDVSAQHPREARYLLARATARTPLVPVAAPLPLDAGLSDVERRERHEALHTLGYVE
ncbi:MAG TPA: sulfatase [Candidatus Binatia bacterium]|jgi:arylsulfatase A-like enzyme|nr:sulfatase [Candidatus Binatia bacterium]